MYTVYQTTNLINGKIYVGVHKTTNPNDDYLGSGMILKNAVEKYGAENFKKEILYICEGIAEAYAKEKEIVNAAFVAREDTYNIATGGSWSVSYKLKRYPFGENHHGYGIPQTPESNRKRSETLKKTNLREDVKQRRSEGAAKSTATKRANGYVSWNKGKHLSESDKQTKSVAALNKEKVQCPHCLRTMDPGNAKQFHFEKCKILNPRSPAVFCKNCGKGIYRENALACSRSCANRLRKRTNTSR